MNRSILFRTHHPQAERVNSEKIVPVVGNSAPPWNSATSAILLITLVGHKFMSPCHSK